MDFSNSLQNQHIEINKKSSIRVGFLLLFAVSVSLNFYLLLFKGQNRVEVAEAISEERKLEPTNLVESQMVGSEQKENIKSVNISTQESNIKPVSFSKSADLNLRGNPVLSLEFKVRNSLNYTACKIISRQEGCEALSAHLGRLLSWLFDVNKSIRNGDSMKVVYQRLEGPEQFKILKLSYTSQLFKKTFSAHYFDAFGQGGYFDLKGKEISKRIVESQSPMREYTEITSLPGDFRKGIGGHSGTDFKAPVGTPVYSGFSGKVTRVNWNVRSNGYCVEIDHPKQGIKTLYLHLSRVFVKPGHNIKSGQKIAESGNTGRTFAPHLHYEIQHQKNRNIIYNPFKSKFHNYYTRKIPANHLAEFHETVKLYDSLLKQS